MTRPMSAEEIQLCKAPPISASFPVVFANGARWTQVEGSCAHCDKKIADEDFQGKITWPIPTVADIQGMAYCHDCLVWTPIRIRLRDDMTMDGPTPGTGKRPWGHWTPQRSLIAKLRALFR